MRTDLPLTYVMCVATAYTSCCDADLITQRRASGTGGWVSEMTVCVLAAKAAYLVLTVGLPLMSQRTTTVVSLTWAATLSVDWVY